MSIERELFQKEYCKVQMITDKGDTFEQYPNGDYVRHSLQLAWLMWQASANRQGYKLVPVDLIERCISHIGIASCHPANSLHDDQQMEVDIDALEKAMIGACDE